MKSKAARYCDDCTRCFPIDDDFLLDINVRGCCFYCSCHRAVYCTWVACSHGFRKRRAQR